MELTADKLAGLAALQDAFAGAAALGAGRPHQSRALPLAFGAMQQREKAAEAAARREQILTALGQAGGSNPQFANPAFQAFAQVQPEKALEIMATPQKAAGPASPIAKLAQDFRKGLIDRETYDAQRKKMLAQGGEGSYRPATPEEAARYGARGGQVDESTGRFYPINPPKGMKITSDGRGGFTLVEGVDVNDPEDVTSPSSPAAMIAAIDGILSDPALDISTGIYSPLQAVPGTPQKRFGARARQLEGQAFLQAFESLKGGGHITEIEGQKATQAIGRLDTAQSADDYRDALGELRGILESGMKRKAGGQAAQPLPPLNSLSDEDLEARIRAMQGG